MATQALPAKMPNAVVALVRLDAVSDRILRDCFALSGVTAISVTSDIEKHLTHEKFEACAINLDDAAPEILERLRTSPSNRRVLVYGISADARDAARFANYGINIVLETPIDRQGALKIIRATHGLVLHELRQYARIPIVLDVQMDVNRQHVSALTHDISFGGMAISSSATFERGAPVSLTFDLPHSSHLMVKGVVAWVGEGGHSAGIRFSEHEPSRDAITHWVDGYLR
jgi:hypothetical protein